jgi:hypothetical protein
MPHVVEVDQSNMIEEPGDTYLAFSDGISWTIKVPFKVKQAGFEALRARRKTKKVAKLMLFAACVSLLIEDHLGQLQRITIDNEYAGRGDDVKAFLLRYIGKLIPNSTRGISKWPQLARNPQPTSRLGQPGQRERQTGQSQLGSS